MLYVIILGKYTYTTFLLVQTLSATPSLRHWIIYGSNGIFLRLVWGSHVRCRRPVYSDFLDWAPYGAALTYLYLVR